MPKIQVYNQQVSAPGPSQSRMASGEAFGAREAKAVTQFGGAVSELSDTIYKRQEQSEISDLTARMSEAQARFTTQWKDRIQKGEVDSDAFLKEFDDHVGELGGEVSTRGAKLYFQKAQAELRSHFQVAAAAGQAEVAGAKAAQNYESSLKNWGSALANDPSSFGVTLSQHDAFVDSLVANGSLPATQAEKFKNVGRTDLAKQSVRGWMKLDPEGTREQLKGGKWNEFFDGDVKHQMFGEVEQEIRGREVEAERRRKEFERLQEEKRKVTQNDFLAKMTKNELTVQDILTSNLEAFGSGSKDTFLNMLESGTQGKLKTDPGTFTELFRRINLPDGDPNKITDANDLNPYVVAKKLDFTDLQHLRNEVEGKNTDAGAMKAALRKQLLDQAGAALVKKNDFAGIQDPVGEENLSKFQKLLFEKEKEFREQKKPLELLYDPNSPDYVGRLIQNFVRDRRTVMKDIQSRVRGDRPFSGPFAPGQDPADQFAKGFNSAVAAPKAEPRKPGESAADYLKRTKGKK